MKPLSRKFLMAIVRLLLGMLLLNVAMAFVRLPPHYGEWPQYTGVFLTYVSALLMGKYLFP